jgi:hypothetical protein
MSLVSQDKLNTEYWAHNCSAKEKALTYTPNTVRCFACNKTMTQTKTDKEFVAPTK